VSLGQQRTGSFQERGGFAALKGRSSTDDLASTTLCVCTATSSWPARKAACAPPWAGAMRLAM
jgi:uncharacterized protein with beta-barrel porin domain